MATIEKQSQLQASHRWWQFTPRELIAYALVALILFAVAVVAPALHFWPARSFNLTARDVREARVIEVVEQAKTETLGGSVITQTLALDIDGERIEAKRAYQAGTAAAFEVDAGTRVLVFITANAQGKVYNVTDRARRIPVWGLTAAFVLLVVAVGGRQGVLSIAGLAASVLVITRFIVPAILGGADPLTICIVGAIVIMTATLTLGHGIGRKTAISLGATAGCLLLAGVLARLAVDFTTLTGLAADDATTLGQLAAGTINMKGLLLGGIILGTVGVLDDVTTTQASTVLELHDADSSLGVRELYRRGMRVGRDHIAATTNTLLLAYAGSALPLMLILAGQHLSAGVMLSFEDLATEVVRTIADSIAIVAAVPVTTAIAAWAAAARPAAPDSPRN